MAIVRAATTEALMGAVRLVEQDKQWLDITSVLRSVAAELTLGQLVKDEQVDHLKHTWTFSHHGRHFQAPDVHKFWVYLTFVYNAPHWTDFLPVFAVQCHAGS